MSSMSSWAQRYGEDIDGYVYIDWRRESSKDEWHTTLFYVTEAADPPYDAVLGRDDAAYYGILKTRRTQ